MLNKSENDPDLLLTKAEEIGRRIKKMEAIDVMEAYRCTQKKIHTNRQRVITNRLMRYAAILSIPLLIATVYLGLAYFNKIGKTQYAVVKTAPGSVVRYDLPDKSVVWLSGESTLRYPLSFDRSRREIDLEGEAYFEVQADKRVPFYVNLSNGLKVYVYGTKFNVRAYKNNPCIETVLEKGKVNIVNSSNNSEYVLQPGNCFSYNKDTKKAVVKPVDVLEETAWKDGKLVFRDTPLDVVLDRLSHHFGVDIQLNSPSVNNYSYRATFQNETLTQILECFSKTVPMRWHEVDPILKKDGTYTKKKVIIDLY